jgi:hypothetical protein
VSSYGRNTFTRDTPCLRLVRCPLYTFAAATCPGTPHLRYRSSLGSFSGRVAPLWTSRPCRLRPRTRCSRPARSASGPLEPSSPKCSHLCLRHRRRYRFNGPPLRDKNSHNLSSISVSVKPIMRRPLRTTEAVRKLKLSAWPDLDEAFEGHLPQQEGGWLDKPKS